MTSPRAAKHQLVTHDGELPEAALGDYLDALGAVEWHRGYQTVAIMGPQSSGKSTLMNHVFGTTFDEMNHEQGRSQTTKGVWLAKAAKPAGFPTLVMDLEGTDGRERGEDDTAFEKQTALFAMAAADVLLVNMWCNDIGREVASGKPLLKTIFQVNLKVFTLRKTVLLFVIRDKSRTPLEMLQSNLREDLDRIWATITKPERHMGAGFDDFFDLRVVALPHYEHAHNQFLTEAAELCARFAKDPSEEGSLRPPGGKASVPINGLVVSMREVWKAVKDNRDLDLPAHRVMVATVRCEEIAASRLANLTASPDLARLVEATTATAAPPGLSQKIDALAAMELAAYDDEAQYFDGGVRFAKRRELGAKLVTALRPVTAAHLGHLSTKLLRRLRDAMAAAGGRAGGRAQSGEKDQDAAAAAAAGFAEVAGRALADVREQWAAALADAVPAHVDEDVEGSGDSDDDDGGGGGTDASSMFSPYKSARAAKAAGAKVAKAGNVSWASVGADATAAFEREAIAAVAAERKDRLAEASHAAERAMERSVGAAVVGLLEDAPADLWERLNALLAASSKKHAAALCATLAGFELGTQETDRASAAMTRRVLEVVETKSRDAAAGAATAMKSAFARVFSKDSKGLPRTWRTTDDVGAINRKAQREAIRVLGLLCVLRLKDIEGGIDGAHDAEAAAISHDAIDAALATFVSEPIPETPPEGVSGEVGAAATAAVKEKETAKPAAAAAVAAAAAATAVYPTEWAGEDDAAVMLGPAECRTVWRQFEADTAYVVSQAMAAKEAAARGGQSSAPLWMIAALIITGFDEVMWLLRNPVTLLLIIGFGLFLRAVYQNLDVDTAMAMGVVPGLIFLGTKVVPTAIKILKKLVDEGGSGNKAPTPAVASGSAGAGASVRSVVSPLSDDAMAGRSRDRVYAPALSSDGVKQRKPGATSSPGPRGDDNERG